MAALEALRDSAAAAGLPALTIHATQRLAQVEGEQFPDLPPLPGTLGELSFHQAVAVDLSQLFLAYGRYDDVAAVLEGIDHPSTRNNLALARFAQGHVAAALDIFEANWHQDRHNLFAMNQLVRLRLWKGGYELAGELSEPLRDSEPQRAEDAYGKLFALLLLGAYDDAMNAWRSVRVAGFWDRYSDPLRSGCAYFAGLAAWRKGEREKAGKLFSEALNLDPENPDADTALFSMTLDMSGGDADLKAGAFRDWFPQSWIAEFDAVKGEHAGEAVLEEQQRSCDAHADYLGAAAELGGEAVRFYALAILKRRACDGDTAAADMLCGLLSRPCGPDDVRLHLDAWLKGKGLINGDEPQQLLWRGKLQEVALRQIRLHTEQRDLGLPLESQARLEQMHQLLAKHDMKRALRIAEALAAAHPDHPVMLGNVAAVKDALGYEIDDFEALYQRAAVLDPTYLFAQVGLARIVMRRGNFERARELLKAVQGREAYHVSEWRAILAAQREMAMAEHDLELALQLEEAMDALNEEFG